MAVGVGCWAPPTREAEVRGRVRRERGGRCWGCSGQGWRRHTGCAGKAGRGGPGRRSQSTGLRWQEPTRLSGLSPRPRRPGVLVPRLALSQHLPLEAVIKGDS